ncbi:MAG: hypothetical protein CSA65_07105 [Proteobacteria bacterium]|nr:MAG: hypothetical protein CSB49_05060 [Pseudomonadota bacterium]PIE17915.1 MAG: hypothetical protein CSA65_07105 [Pseudomonadota bacterium]
MSVETERQSLVRRPPSGTAVARQIAGLSLRRARRSRLLRVVLALLALPVLATIVGVLSGRNGAAFFEKVLALYLSYLVPLVLALFSSQSVAEEVQGRTITYLWSRPIARWALPVGKYLGTVAVTGGLMLLSLVACYLVAMIPAGGSVFSELPLLALGLTALGVGTLYFAAVASAFGALVTSFPFALMLLYVLAIDIGMGFVPGLLRVVAMTVHLRAIAGLYKPQTSLFSADPHLDATISLPVVVVMATLWLGLTVLIASTSEYRTDR